MGDIKRAADVEVSNEYCCFSPLYLKNGSWWNGRHTP